MTRHVVVAVKDRAVEAFSRPFFVPSIGAATRSFADEVNRNAPDNPMFGHPDDYDMWYMADWDDESGEFLAVEVRVISRGKDVWHG